MITLPPQVRKRLGVPGRAALYWHLWRRGEAILSVRPERTGGRPDTARLLRELAEAHERIEALLRQQASLERTRYAEGYNAGYQAVWSKVHTPSGPSARRQGRRLAQFYADQARQRSRRQTVEVAAPVMEEPSAPAPSPLVPSGGDAASGGEIPQAAHDDE